MRRRCSRPSSPQQPLAADRRAAAEGEPVYDEAILLADGEPRTYVTVTFPLPDDDGQPIETCTIATDVTERRERESERRERDRVGEPDQRGARASTACSPSTQPIFDLATGDAVLHASCSCGCAPTTAAAAAAGRVPARRRALRADSGDRHLDGRQALALGRGHGAQVNLSAVTLCDPAARREIVDDARRRPRGGAQRLVFEITETAAVEHLEAARIFAADVCALGCGLALDDFGTGFGSFTYLRTSR